MIRCICFARVSTAQQDLSAQIDAVKRSAKFDGYLENEIVVVEGKESAIKLKEEERQTLNELKNLVNDNPTVESIYFFAVDRLARRMSVIMSVKEWADENKINLVFLEPQRMATLQKNNKGEWVENEITTLLLSMLAHGAQMEMKTKKARFKTKKDEMRKQGKLAQGKQCFGYIVDENKYVIPDEEYSAPIVRNIFNDYLTGEYTLCSLYNKYMKNGTFEITTLESAQKRRMYQILKNAKYAGYSVSSQKKNKDTGEFYKAITQYPPIISKEIFEQTQELLTRKRSISKQDTKNIYYAKGIIKCGECGHTMKGHSSNNTYKCVDYGHSFNVNLSVIDSLTWATAKEFYSFYACMNLEGTKKENKNKLEDYYQEVRVLEEKIKMEEEKKDKIAIKYSNGKVSEKIFDRIVEECDKNIKGFNNMLSDFLTKIQSINQLLIEADNKEYISPIDIKDYKDTQRVDIIKKVIKEVVARKDNDGWIRIDFEPKEILSSVIPTDIEQRTYYKYRRWGNSIQVKAWSCGKCVNEDVSFLIHRRFTNKGKIVVE